jgi:hypothetical protein
VLVSSLLPFYPLLSQKPIRTPRVNTLPPRPDTITAESLPNGRILVKWTEVPVAKGYFLGRSRGNEGWRRIQVPMRGPGSNYYTDFDVHPGVRYRYQVATIDSADRVSLRINSDTIVGWQGQVYAAPSNVIATVSSPGQVTLRWTSPQGATQYRVERRMDPQPTDGSASTFFVRSTTFVDRIGTGDVDRTVFYLVTGLSGVAGAEPGPAGRSNAVRIPGRSTDSSSTASADASGGDGGTASGASSSVLVTVAPDASVRVGANARLAAGAGAQWLSLDPRIATVNPEGAVIGRARGETQIVAVSRGADGAVRVSVVRVTVVP